MKNPKITNRKYQILNSKKTLRTIDRGLPEAVQLTRETASPSIGF